MSPPAATVGVVPQLPDTAGSARARMRLFAVLIPITAYWAIYALYLLFLPEGTPGATLAVVLGAVCLVLAGLYALATWGTAKRKRGLHILALVMTVLGVSELFIAQTLDVLVLAPVNLIALVLLARTIPRGVAKAPAAEKS